MNILKKAFQFQTQILINKQTFSFSFNQIFKQRSKLSEFYKNVHPDILGNAPEKIKEENSRSLKILNSYLDQLSQNQGTTNQKLTFYLPDKVNKKAKKYLQIEVNLKEIQANASQEALQQHIDSQIQILLNELKYVRLQTNPFLAKQLKQEAEKNQIADEGMDEEAEFFKYQQTMEPFDKNDSLIDQIYKRSVKQRIGSLLFEHISKINEQKIIDSVRDEMYSMDMPYQKPLLWAKIVASDSEYKKNIETLFSELIDPRLIYLDPTLTQKQINQFAKSLIIQDERDYYSEKFQQLKEVFQHMESQSPPLGLYVTKKYSGTDIPGFFSIPYNFKMQDVLGQYEVHAGEAIRIRQELDQLYNRVNKLQQDLQKNFELRPIEIEQANTSEEFEKQILFLKKLNKIITDIHINDRDLLEKLKRKQIKCFQNKEKYEENKLFQNKQIINLTYDFTQQNLIQQIV